MNYSITERIESRATSDISMLSMLEDTESMRRKTAASG